MGKDLDLIQAVKSNDVGLVRKILGKLSSSKAKKVSKKLNINIQDEDGFTALHHSALQGNTDITMALLDMECNVNARDKKGMSPLHLASWAGKTEITKLLVDARACVNTCADSGDTPLHLGCQHNNAGVVEILLDSNVDCTVVNKRGESALDLGCRFGHVQVVEMLLKSKDCQKLLTLFDENPKTADPPLHIACKTGREEIVVMLLDAGANVNQRGTNGTALHEASLYGKTEVVKILLDNEADVSITNEEGYTPLDVVMQFTSSRASQDIKDLLRESSKNKVIIAKAVHDYRNMYDPTCLTFKTGDAIEILEQNENGRWKGKTMFGSREIIGYFPSSMVKMSNPRKPTGKALSMKDVGVLPVGKYEMVTLPSASGQSSPVNGKRPRMSSFGKPNNGRASPSPPMTPEHTPCPAPNPITNGIKENKLFQKNQQDSLKYVEVSVENPSSPTSPTSSNGSNSRPTNYAEVVLMTGRNGIKDENPPPSLPQKNYRSDSENGENGEGDDIWIKNSPNQPELPPKGRAMTPEPETPTPLKTKPETPATPSKTKDIEVTNTNTEIKPEPNVTKKNVRKYERKLKSWELDVEIELEKEKEQNQRKVQSEVIAPVEETPPKLDSRKAVDDHTETLKPNYEDMTLNSPDKDEPLFKRQARKEKYSPKSLDHSEHEARSLPGLTKRQLLSYENVELKPRKADDIKSMLITDIDQGVGGEEYVPIQRGLSPVPNDNNPKPNYENITKEFENESSKEGKDFSTYESMNTEDDDSAQKYVTMKRGVSSASDGDANDRHALTKSESYENIDIKSSSSKSPPVGSTEYMTMDTEVDAAVPPHDYINVKIPVLSEESSGANAVQPTGLKMSEYNALYDWLESCKLAIYIDNFVKGGFDMISINGLTAEDLTAINITKTGHRKKLLSDAAKQKLPDDVFPRERPEDIMTWLRLIHLDQYIPQLIDNGFDDMEFVQDITIEDLDSIGITKPGHQRKLWLAVGALTPSSNGAPTPTTPSTANNANNADKKDKLSLESERYMETDLDMVHENQVQIKQDKESSSTDIDSALSRLPADGASDVGFADEEVTTLVRNSKIEENRQTSLANAVASLHIESLNETRGSTPDLDDILDCLEDDPNSSTETQQVQSINQSATETHSSPKSSSKLNTQNVSAVSSDVATGTNERTSAEVPDEATPSRPTENDKKSTGSDENVSSNTRNRFNSMESNENRIRGLSFDSKTSKKAPPPPVKPKSFKKPPPKIAPKPNIGQVKAKTTEHETQMVNNNLSEQRNEETERIERRYTTGSTTRSKPSPPVVLCKVRHGSVHSTSSEDSVQSAIEDVEKQKLHYEDRRKSFEKLRRRFTDPESMGSLSSDGNDDSKEKIDNKTSPDDKKGLQEQIKEVFRRSRENLVNTDEPKQTSQPETESNPQPAVSDEVDVTDEDLEKDQQYTEDLMKDINSMLSDFSTEIDCMFDKSEEKSTTV